MWTRIIRFWQPCWKFLLPNSEIFLLKVRNFLCIYILASKKYILQAQSSRRVKGCIDNPADIFCTKCENILLNFRKQLHFSQKNILLKVFFWKARMQFPQPCRKPAFRNSLAFVEFRWLLDNSLAIKFCKQNKFWPNWRKLLRCRSGICACEAAKSLKFALIEWRDSLLWQNNFLMWSNLFSLFFFDKHFKKQAIFVKFITNFVKKLQNLKKHAQLWTTFFSVAVR